MQRPQQRYRNYNKREPIVEDLRDKLNRMRLEKPDNTNQDAITAKLPPPDPAYNFLKDPLRGDTVQKSQPKKLNKKEVNRSNEHKPKGIREFLKQPININVEVTYNSGERKCTLDQSKIVEIPAAYKQYPKRPQFRRAPGEFHKYYNDQNPVDSENTNKNTSKHAIVPYRRQEREENLDNPQDRKNVATKDKLKEK